MTILPKLLQRVCACLSLLSLMACVANPAMSEADRLLAQGRVEDGVLRLEQAMRDAPGDRELRTRYFRQRDTAVGELLAQAQSAQRGQQADLAQDLYRRVLVLDPSNARANSGVADLVNQRRLDDMLAAARLSRDRGDTAASERAVRAILAESPGHVGARQLLQALRDQAAAAEPVARALSAPFAMPITLEFREASIRTVFEVISRTAGINFVFDKDVRTDARVTIFVRNTSVEDIVKLVLATNQLERKMLNDNSILVYPNTPVKVREYQELVTRSFYLGNADVKQAQAMVRTLVKTRDIFIDEKLNLIVIKDTADAVRLAERLIESLDMAEPEVMLDVEVLEITRGQLQDLGMRLPDQIGYGLLQPTTSTTTVNGSVSQTSTNLGGTLAPGYVDLQNRGNLTAFVSNPAVMLNLRSEAGGGKLLANPRIRVRNRDKAKIHIGDRLPVFTTTSTANVGVAASVAYLDVGLKLEVEPNVYLDDEVAIKIGLEVSSIAREVPGPANSLAYQIGTRSAATVLRLRNGETQVLAGLISDEERSSANRIPGLGDLPLLGRLFSSQRDNSSKTEIVLLITPRIVRNVTRPPASASTLPAGSESAVGAPAFTLRGAAPRALSLSSSPGAASRSESTPAVAPLARPPAPSGAVSEERDEGAATATPPPRADAAPAAPGQAAPAPAGNAGEPPAPAPGAAPVRTDAAAPFAVTPPRVVP